MLNKVPLFPVLRLISYHNGPFWWKSYNNGPFCGGKVTIMDRFMTDKVVLWPVLWLAKKDTVILFNKIEITLIIPQKDEKVKKNLQLQRRMPNWFSNETNHFFLQ